MDKATLGKMADQVMSDLVRAIEGQNVLPGNMRPVEIHVGRNVAAALREYYVKYTGKPTAGAWSIRQLPVVEKRPVDLPAHHARLDGVGEPLVLSWEPLFEAEAVGVEGAIEEIEGPRVELSTAGRDYFKRKAEGAGARAVWTLVFPGSSVSWAAVGVTTQAFCVKIARAVMEAVGGTEGVVLMYPSVKMETDAAAEAKKVVAHATVPEAVRPPNVAVAFYETMPLAEKQKSEFDETAGRG